MEVATAKRLRTAFRRGNVTAMHRAFALSLLLCACAHDRAAVVSAHVVTAQGSSQATADGASGTLTCPNAMPQDLGTVDEDGQLRAQHIGAVALECTVTIALRGYQPFTARIADACTARDSGRCANAEIQAVLAAAPQGGSSNPGK